MESGDCGRAHRCFTASLALRRQVGDRWGVPQLLANLAAVARLQGDLSAAHSLYAQSIRAFHETRSVHGVADCLEGFAELAALRGEVLRAASLAGAAGNLRARTGVPLSRKRQAQLERTVDMVRETTDTAAWERAWASGQMWQLDQAIENALVQPSTKLEPAQLTRAKAPVRGARNRLTAREHDVVALIARGQTNYQIAEALVISPSTASVHVKNILKKLGFTSRAQIAAWSAIQKAAAREIISGLE